MTFSMFSTAFPRTAQQALRAICSASALVLACLAGGCGGPTTIAKVGPQAITDKDFLEQSIRSGQGSQVMNMLVIQNVVKQEAQEKNLLPTDADVTRTIAELTKANPQIQQQINQNRAAADSEIRFQLELYNLLKQGLNLTPDMKKAWFQAHHTLFDSPATISLATIVFDSPDQAAKGRAMLQKGSAPEDVAKELGTSSSIIPQNGRPSPPQTRDQLNMYGPAVGKTIDKMFSPETKPGFISDPVTTLYPGKVILLDLVNQVPAKVAAYDANVDAVERFMAAEEYGKKTGKGEVPANPTRQDYVQLTNKLTQGMVQDLVNSYFTKNMITINNPQLRDAVKQMYQMQPSGAPGALPPGHPPVPTNHSMPTGSALPPGHASMMSNPHSQNSPH